MIDRRGFLRLLAGAAALPVVPIHARELVVTSTKLKPTVFLMPSGATWVMERLTLEDIRRIRSKVTGAAALHELGEDGKIHFRFSSQELAICRMRVVPWRDGPKGCCLDCEAVGHPDIDPGFWRQG